MYRRKIYRVLPEQVEVFNAFFLEHLLPNQRKHGARLVGRWVTEDRTEIMALWEYRNHEEYAAIERAVQADPMHAAAQARRTESEPLHESARQDLLTETGAYHSQQRVNLAVSAYVTNVRGEVLLVRTNWRPDTWELPGGQVEPDETPVAAVRREVMEESGIDIRVEGVTGTYFNMTIGLMILVLRGVAIGGSVRTSDETSAVEFVQLTEDTLGQYVTRPHIRVRVRDAMRGAAVPTESFNVRPYSIVERIGS